ncbi:MAG TPA: hypothetical protein VFF64_10280 [Candidatus Eremiobacteraceae bacterium]|nr:hypothetical protein [Candidatus Eremiobacteraceae bacterium]
MVYSLRMEDFRQSDFRKDSSEKASRGFVPVGIFLFFGAVMASLAGSTLIWRGTFLDRIWILNPGAYRQLASFGRTIGILFLMLGVILALAAAGWLRHRLWGWRLAVIIIATQVLGDLVSAFRGDILRGGVGVAIAGALLLYLWRPHIRSRFHEDPEPGILT